MGNIDKKIDLWKKKLLDSGKRNRLIHFKETKRSNINILEPSMYELYNAIVNEEKELSFSHPVEISIEQDDNVFQSSSDETKKTEIEVVQGDISTNQSITEQQKTLKSLRSRARTALEEQGVNILYLAFGFLTWKETVGSAQILRSPLVLVPVRLTIASMTSPYKLNLHDDEIVFNPTLKHKLENDFNIELPEFDSNVHEVGSYLDELEQIFSQLNWKVDLDVSLSMFSFLKINMYMDLHKHADMLNNHFVVKALCGDATEVMGIPAGLNHYDHDKSEKPIDVYQTVDADASQQDAVVLADKGVSFVLQGPPGTGKSQTITNIISQSLATGKKVLFVSEKMAALDVVFNRLSSVGLSDFCLSLHNHKVNKKEILSNLSETLSLEKIKTKEESLYLLDTLEKKRALLNEYVEELHIVREPLQKSVYEVNGLLAKLDDITDVLFRFDHIENVSIEEFRTFEYLLNNLAQIMGELSVAPDSNVWRGSVITHATHELRQDIEYKATNIMNAIRTFEDKSNSIFEALMFPNTIVFENLTNLRELFALCEGAYAIPKEWLEKECRDSIIALVDEFADKNKMYDVAVASIENRNQPELFIIDFNDKKKKVSSILEELQNSFKGEKYDSMSQIFDCRQNAKSYIEAGEMAIEPILRISDEISEKLGMPCGKTLKEIMDLKELLHGLNQSLVVTPLWFRDIKGERSTIALRDLTDEIQELKLKKQDCMSVEQSLDFTSLALHLKAVCQTSNTMEMVQSNLTTIRDIIQNGLEELTYLKNQNYKFSRIDNRLSKSNLDSMNQILRLTKQCEVLVSPTDIWFQKDGLKSVENFVELVESKINAYNSLSNEVLTEYNPSILHIDAKAMLSRFENKYTAFYKMLISDYRKDKSMIHNLKKSTHNKLSDVEIIVLLNNLTELAELEEFLGHSNYEAKAYLGELFDGKSTQVQAVRKNIKTFNYIQNAVENQFSDELKNILMKNETFESYGVSTEEIAKKISSEKLELFLRVFFGGSGESVELEKIDERINQFLEYCNLVETVVKLTDKMETNSEQYSNYFGELYAGEDTDVEQIEIMIERFQKVMDCFVTPPTQEVEQLVLSGKNVGAFDAQIAFLQDGIDGESLQNVSVLFSTDEYTTLDIADIREKSQEVLDLIQALENEIDCFANETEDVLLYQTYEDCISNLEQIDRVKNEFEHNHSKLSNELGSYFDGIQTQWEELKKVLDWLEQFAKQIESTDLKVQFTDNVISLAHKKDFADLLSHIDEFISDCGEDFEWFNALFEAPYQVIDLPYNEVAAKLSRCIENLHGLEEWIDFKNIQIQCNESGLTDVVATILEEWIPHTSVIHSFKKRFYKLWQDAIAKDSPSISKFRRKTQDEIIETFQKYDLEQMKIAEFRIRELLLSELPELDDSTAPYGDVAILKRELSKKRKIMPIRKLFAKIPSLLLTLKPCLMMSPLSVSLFLNSEVYDFDVVIFDEASQVCTENAIGAIMRAKQVVIAGDSKQLPPTNFFATTTTKDSGYDNDESEEIEEDDGDFESILDEMLITFPERTLKWHYRSKNEDLITFSNIKIYNNSLMTFPSTIESGHGHGVEYIYVEDGIYDRGGKKHNLMEAKKIAELVFEHFESSNHRSIGVITFSSSQQQAVEDAIAKLRLENPIFEPYFNEDRKDAFFVKNIENVQGDERDTIILGIGYGKDASGVMYMNFGPLSRAGGYRRLNVAITRAKYNLKLVGSIRPTDIRVGDASSDGVKMLRLYIEFAIGGRDVLQNEISHTQVVDLDSPFEEAVFDFLIAKGYRVSTQVGCSGYRIDMAVHHPTLDGRFVIGIECDGAMYHSSRTARERDRLRQTILEDMGWTFHRIWSTDWIKDSTKEGKLLVDAIDRAINHYVDIFDEKLEQSTEITNQINSELQQEYAYTVDVIEGDNNEKIKFAPYIEADIQTVLSSQNNEIENICDALTLVIAVEYPIHYELLCKRVAPITGNQKATVKVREKVDFALRVLGDVFVVKNEFYYPKDYIGVVAKTPVEGQIQRPIHYISHEEIGVAMMNIVSASFGISKGDLFRVLAREFGFQRMGVNITNTFDVVFQELLTIQKISFLENRVMMGQ